ncbi:MAG: hypothetical protein AB1717_05195 [Pseudomonadota bacterium]
MKLLLSPPSFWQALWPSAVWMLLAYALILPFVRGKAAISLIFSSAPLVAWLEAWLFKPLMNLVDAEQRLPATIWLLIVVSYLQWTLLAAGLAYAWRFWGYWRSRRVLRNKEAN